MTTKLVALMIPLALAGCWESEESCYERLKKDLVDDQILAGVSLGLIEIYFNKDLNVCDYTVLGNNIVKID